MAGEPGERTAQVRAIFDRIAPDYDRAGPGCFAHYGRVLVDAAGLAPGQRVLDVATGRGAVLLPAAERVGPSGRAVGVDLSPAMVEAARAEAAARGLAVEVATMDIEALALPDAAFDRVLCGFGVMFAPRLDVALGELARVLAPGGTLAVSTWRRTQADDVLAVLAAHGREEAGPDIRALGDPALLGAALRDAGLADVAIAEVPATFRYLDLEDYWQCARGTGARRLLDALAGEDERAVRAALAERLAPATRADGIHLDASALIGTARRD